MLIFNPKLKMSRDKDRVILLVYRNIQNKDFLLFIIREYSTVFTMIYYRI